MRQTKVAAVAGRPRKGVMPNTAGVSGQLVELGPSSDLEFVERKHTSPYDPLLKSLAVAGSGKALKFGDARAAVALKNRAKKLGFRLAFAEGDGALFVKFVGMAEPKAPAAATPGSAVAKAEVAVTRRGRLLQGLKFGPQTVGRLTALLRDKGDTGVTNDLVDRLLESMEEAGDVVFRASDRSWLLTATSKA